MRHDEPYDDPPLKVCLCGHSRSAHAFEAGRWVGRCECQVYNGFCACPCFRKKPTTGPAFPGPIGAEEPLGPSGVWVGRWCCTSCEQAFDVQAHAELSPWTIDFGLCSSCALRAELARREQVLKEKNAEKEAEATALRGEIAKEHEARIAILAARLLCSRFGFEEPGSIETARGDVVDPPHARPWNEDPDAYAVRRCFELAEAFVKEGDRRAAELGVPRFYAKGRAEQ